MMNLDSNIMQGAGSLTPPQLQLQESGGSIGSVFEDIIDIDTREMKSNSNKTNACSKTECNKQRSTKKRNVKSCSKSNINKNRNKTSKTKTKRMNFEYTDDADSQHSDEASSNNNNNNGNKPNNNALKCIWCENKRARNDLCNRCRQKVESRARKLNEQKIIGEQHVVENIVKFLNKNCDFGQLDAFMTSQEYGKLFVELYPFLLLRYQADNTYRGKRNNSCWNVAESTLRILMSKFYGGREKVPTLNGKSIESLKRKELCQVLEQTAFEKITQAKTKSKRNNGVNSSMNNNNDNDNSMKRKHNYIESSMSGLSSLGGTISNEPESPETAPVTTNSIASFGMECEETSRIGSNEKMSAKQTTNNSNNNTNKNNNNSNSNNRTNRMNSKNEYNKNNNSNESMSTSNFGGLETVTNIDSNDGLPPSLMPTGVVAGIGRRGVAEEAMIPRIRQVDGALIKSCGAVGSMSSLSGIESGPSSATNSGTSTVFTSPSFEESLPSFYDNNLNGMNCCSNNGNDFFRYTNVRGTTAMNGRNFGRFEPYSTGNGMFGNDAIGDNNNSNNNNNNNNNNININNTNTQAQQRVPNVNYGNAMSAMIGRNGNYGKNSNNNGLDKSCFSIDMNNNDSNSSVSGDFFGSSTRSSFLGANRFDCGNTINSNTMDWQLQGWQNSNMNGVNNQIGSNNNSNERMFGFDTIRMNNNNHIDDTSMMQNDAMTVNSPFFSRGAMSSNKGINDNRNNRSTNDNINNNNLSFETIGEI